MKFKVFDTKLKCFGYACRGKDTDKNNLSFTLKDEYVFFHKKDKHYPKPTSLNSCKKSVRELFCDNIRFIKVNID